MTPPHPRPLVSVICFCKDRLSLIARCVDSVLNQTYANIEFVVQDGASTDGTLEYLLERAERDPRIKIVSHPDSGPAEAFWKVLHRCQGDYIATCLSDEELVPDAVEKAVGWFAAEPGLGAITCDGYTTDADGKVIGEFKAGAFDLVAYLFGTYCPFWPGSFFRRSALLDVGLGRPGWTVECLEFEIWCRLAASHEVKYIPEPLSRYAIHPGQLSNTPANFREHIEGRLLLIEKMFSHEGFLGVPDKSKLEAGINADMRRLEAEINQVSQFEFHTRAHGLDAEEKAFSGRLRALRDNLAKQYDYSMIANWRETRRRRTRAERQRTADRVLRIWAMIGESTTAAPPETTSVRLKSWMHRALLKVFAIHRNNPVQLTLLGARGLGLSGNPVAAARYTAEKDRLERRGRNYDFVARRYEARGQISQALEMWRHAEPLNDPAVDGLACQAALKLPSATYASIGQQQQRWADRHIAAAASRADNTFPRFDGQRKIRIGYHCSFMDADTIRSIMRRVMAAHDRAKFEVVGYAPMSLPDNLVSVFDTVRQTASLDDTAFAELVRRDNIDVLVELSGFSPGHRFVAISHRCAPVQVSYLNHFATSGVPNVDYILSDEICTPSDGNVDRLFSETIYRLPGCLLCYDYADSDCPPVVDPPSLASRRVTFGCFGSGGKINTPLIGHWAELLHRVPDAILLIQNSQLTSFDNRRFMADRFRRHGIPPQRLDLRAGTGHRALLDVYREVDISLDTTPYGGGNTVAESLWQGVPVVTLKGSLFTARYGASLLVAAGCGELVAETKEQYLKIAVNLAKAPDRLLHLRRNLRSLYSQNGLNDSARFARKLERAYREMIDRKGAA